MASPPRVCVTGGGGFVASWLVKLLLSRGYAVHATVRDPSHPKNAFLEQLDNASENLRLFKADVLDYGTLTAAFAGCDGVFHPASPVPGDKMKDPEERGPDMINNKFWPLVDVGDVVHAMLLAYEKAESSGRYICALDQMDIKNLVVFIKSMYPNYNYVDKQVPS
ncbi:hypothetical protein EJB05_43566, partial [Eragrostis curvula]